MWPFKKSISLSRYGWSPDLPDYRDQLFSESLKAPVTLPASVDLRPNCSPVEDQGDLGACTAHAIVGAVEFLEIKDKHPDVRMSRLFVYYNERALEGTVKTDSGAQLRDGIKTLNKQGVCAETLWPYNISKFTQKPPSKCYTAAKLHEAVTYKRLITLSDMKQCLAAGYPFIFGFTVYESFESDEVAQTGIVPMPGPNEQVLGGHAVLAVGYDDATSRVLVKNSWSINWGIKGYFTMPYAYISNNNLADDLWTVRKTKSE
jgi:C1A family cysteine protease